MNDMELYCIDAAVELAWMCEREIDAAFNRGITQSRVQESIRFCAYHWAKSFAERTAGICWDDMQDIWADSLRESLNRLT